MTALREPVLRLDCFGGRVAVLAGGPDAEAAIPAAAGRLLEAHRTLSRFLPDSELSRLNRDPRPVVPARALIRRFAAAVHHAGDLTSGLVDATQVGAIERAGYRGSLVGSEPLPLEQALAATHVRAPAEADPASGWRLVGSDEAAGAVVRPPGLRLDSGGLGKGLAADLAAERLAAQASFAVDCAGDIRIGGTGGAPRTVEVADPFGGAPVHRLQVRDGAVATSGIGRRSWIDSDGLPAHHLLDPRSGRPAYTGVVQATALAPTALEAEILAKAALLSGPGVGERWLMHGGVLCLDDGSVRKVPAEHGLATAA